MEEGIVIRELITNTLVFDTTGSLSMASSYDGLHLKSTSLISDLDDADNIIVVSSDVMKENMTVGKRIINAYKRGAALSVIDVESSRLFKYAGKKGILTDDPKRILSGIREAFVNKENQMPGEESLKVIVDDLSTSRKTVFVVSQDSPNLRHGVIEEVRSLVRDSSSGLLVLSSYSNSRGLIELGLHKGREIEDVLKSGRIKALFVIGEDPGAVSPEL